MKSDNPLAHGGARPNGGCWPRLPPANSRLPATAVPGHRAPGHPAYTATARQILGQQPAFAIDQMLVADTDAARARQTARRSPRFLSGLPVYAASFTRMGFTATDIAEVTDRLVDDLVLWGDAATIAARIGQYLQAGADHVVLHVLSDGSQPGPGEVARALAASLPR